MGWDLAIDELAAESELESQAVTEACEVRTPSDDESSSVSLPASQRPTLWWVQRLLKLGKGIKKVKAVKAKQIRPVRIISACTGCCAEGAVLEVSHLHFLGIRFRNDDQVFTFQHAFHTNKFSIYCSIHWNFFLHWSTTGLLGTCRVSCISVETLGPKFSVYCAMSSPGCWIVI